MNLALVEAARSGDEEAFASIARGSADRLFAVAHRILRDVGRAEDAVQQTLVTAWRELPALREIERFEAWIHRILVHACYAEAKRASKWSANVVALPARRARDAGHHPGHRHARRARSRVPPAADGATRGLRAPSLPRLVGRGDRREPRCPDRNDQVEAPLRNVHPPGGTRCRCPDDQHRVPGADGMNENEFDRTARAWLDDGPTQMSDRAVLSALEEIHTTRQRRSPVAGVEGNTCEHVRPRGHRRGLRGRGRPHCRQRRSAPAGRIERRRPSRPRARPPTPRPARHHRRLMTCGSTSRTSQTTFVSPTYGYSFKYLDRGGLAPATERWDPVNAAASTKRSSRAGPRPVRCRGDRLGRLLRGRVDGDRGRGLDR